MCNWFTVEEIDSDTYAISEYQHWEETHCYLLTGSQKALLIDTGLGVCDIGTLVRSLTSLPVQVVTTHAHWDHIGGHACFDNFAVHRAEKEWLTGHFPIPLPVVKRNLLQGNAPFPSGFDIDAYRLFQGEPSQILEDGDRIDLGNRTVSIVHTPGHSPGHICFFEPERGYLYTGDLIYAGCLYAFYPTTDPVAFRQSVRKVKSLPVERLLPAHHKLSIPISMLEDVDEAFASLEKQGKLRQGTGVFSFSGFEIQL